MKRRSRAAFFGVLTLLLSLLSGASAESDRGLFVIARSKNANILHYDIQLQKDGSPDRDQPVSAYWILLAENGRREALTWLERQLAYGWEITSPVRDSGFSLRLVALPGRTVHVHRAASGSYRAIISIAGEHAILERVYVKTEEGSPVPRVVYVDLFGHNLATQAVVSERILP